MALNHIKYMIIISRRENAQVYSGEGQIGADPHFRDGDDFARGIFLAIAEKYTCNLFLDQSGYFFLSR